jgi:hypothetical protein
MADLTASGGELRVPAWHRAGERDYRQLVLSAQRWGKVPRGKRLTSRAGTDTPDTPESGEARGRQRRRSYSLVFMNAVRVAVRLLAAKRRNVVRCQQSTTSRSDPPPGETSRRRPRYGTRDRTRAPSAVAFWRKDDGAFATANLEALASETMSLSVFAPAASGARVGSDQKRLALRVAGHSPGSL